MVCSSPLYIIHQQKKNKDDLAPACETSTLFLYQNGIPAYRNYYLDNANDLSYTERNLALHVVNVAVFTGRL